MKAVKRFGAGSANEKGPDEASGLYVNASGEVSYEKNVGGLVVGNLAGIRKMTRACDEKPHGSPLRYRAGCRCDACRIGQSEYARCRHRLKREGQRNAIVSADVAREHLVALQREHGVKVDAVAILSGVSRRDLMQIRSGRQMNIREAKERAIVAIGPEAGAFNGLVPADKTRERLLAIRAAGLSWREIGRRLGLRSKPRIGRKAFVYAEKARQVRKLFYEVVVVPRAKAKASSCRYNESFVRPTKAGTVVASLSV